MAMPLTHHQFTVDEYHRMAKAGILHEADRVELIDGQVVEMSPTGPRHAACVRKITRLLYRLTGESVIVGVQDPVVLAAHWEPQPDIVLLEPEVADNIDHHPGSADILLVIEVADTSVEYDRSVKVSGYARAGIPEVWIVNLTANRIEVYRDPTGTEYAGPRIVGPDATLTPATLPTVSIRGSEMLA